MRQKRFLTIAVVGLVSVVLTSCLGEKIVVNRQVESSQDGALLLGRQTLDQFHKEPFKDWFAKEYSDYTPHSEAIKSLKKAGINSTRISVFIGTWDTDSQREFSRLIKVLDVMKYPKAKLEIIALNRKKESPAGEEAANNIHQLPTIIIRKYDKVLGRLVGNPKTGLLEQDLVQVLNKK